MYLFSLLVACFYLAVGIEATPNLRILPLGASITAGVGSSSGNGYRELLRDQLSPTEVTYIGTKCSGNMSNANNEGHPGFVISQMRAVAQPDLSLNPNVVLVYVGTNDMKGFADPSKAPDALRDLTRYLVSNLPGALIVVSKLFVNGDSTVQKRINTFNAALTGFESLGNVIVADLSAALLPSDLSSDGTHPRDVGYAKMTAVFYDVLVQAEDDGRIPDTDNSLNTSTYPYCNGPYIPDTISTTTTTTTSIFTTTSISTTTTMSIPTTTSISTITTTATMMPTTMTISTTTMATVPTTTPTTPSTTSMSTTTTTTISMPTTTDISMTTTMTTVTKEATSNTVSKRPTTTIQQTPTLLETSTSQKSVIPSSTSTSKQSATRSSSSKSHPSITTSPASTSHHSTTISKSSKSTTSTSSFSHNTTKTKSTSKIITAATTSKPPSPSTTRSSPVRSSFRTITTTIKCTKSKTTLTTPALSTRGLHSKPTSVPRR